jgi:hypothetical protein
MNTMSQTVEKPNISRILGNVPFEHCFHFSTPKGTYTGITATNIADFAL